jgi:hypothetical protein
VVDGDGLENRCTRKGIGGSNPSPSANLRSGARRRLPAIAATVGLLVAGPAPGEAQPVPRTITCDAANGRTVTALQVMNGTIAKAAIDQDGRAVIQYDPRAVSGITTQQQLFVYAHECGHLALGHDVRAASFSVAQEQIADCHGIRSLMTRVGFTTDDVSILERAMRDVESGSARHFPWRVREYDLQGCLPQVVARRQAEARKGELSADECVVHNDAENAILSKSRDGRVIDGSYSVRNRCARDVTCQFTIEIGTMLESDIDVGGWRSFRVQQTVVEQHTLQPARAGSAAAEFRFHGGVDAVPAAEAVDFRVVRACQ